jgi:hypothetical protein
VAPAAPPEGAPAEQSAPSADAGVPRPVPGFTWQ